MATRAASGQGLASGAGAAVPAGRFYANYHGHLPRDLKATCELLRVSHPGARRIWLAGDSSLDNKHWFFSGRCEKEQQLDDPAFTAPAVNGYEGALSPPRMVQDVSYWMNRGAAERFGPGSWQCVNCSVEESTISARDDGLLPQDEFLRDHVGAEDLVVISVGGNDVALRPTTATITNLATLLGSPDGLIRSGGAPGMSYFIWLFGQRLDEILRQLVAGPSKPRKILVCMIYYLDERPGGSWADGVLDKLGYNTNPEKLQLIIRTLYERLSERGFDVPGTDVELFPLFEVLNGKDSGDYVQRVEPSVQGGRKMAEALLHRLLPPQ